MPHIRDADWVINTLAAHPQGTAALRSLAPQQIAISILTVAEIYEGAFNSTNPQARLASYRQLLAQFRILNITDPIAERFAELRSLLRRQGQLIPDLDLLLAAMALHYDLTVLTFNLRHLSRIPDLKLYRQN